jgi:hypothetical protein
MLNKDYQELFQRELRRAPWFFAVATPAFCISFIWGIAPIHYLAFNAIIGICILPFLLLAHFFRFGMMIAITLLLLIYVIIFDIFFGSLHIGSLLLTQGLCLMFFTSSLTTIILRKSIKKLLN